ncbi:MAG: hypothetical protein LBF89_02810 [Bacteroidales bacterium]|jgi:hypothetical protein|nr:hypothetical protein [Bacteroidales bacterium]
MVEMKYINNPGPTSPERESCMFSPGCGTEIRRPHEVKAPIPAGGVWDAGDMNRLVCPKSAVGLLLFPQ